MGIAPSILDRETMNERSSRLVHPEKSRKRARMERREVGLALTGAMSVYGAMKAFFLLCRNSGQQEVLGRGMR